MQNKPYHHGNLRESLIKAGIELINNEGENNLSLRKVAAICGVSQAAPYSHFQNKQDLLTAMQGFVIDEFMQTLENSIITCQYKNDERLLIEIGKSYVMFFIDNPLYFSFIFSQHCMQVNLSLYDDDENNFKPFQLFKATAIHILKQQNIADEKIEDAIISMWATVHGLASIATMKNVHYNKAWQTKIEDIIWHK